MKQSLFSDPDAALKKMGAALQCHELSKVQNFVKLLEKMPENEARDIQNIIASGSKSVQ